MRSRYRSHHILEVILSLICLAGLLAGTSWAHEDSKYLEAVREFCDLVLEHGIDKVGDVTTPLFYDGLHIHRLTPVEWIDPDGTRWVLSNFASQQTLLRTLDGLSNITGDTKYRQAAMDAIKYAFDHVRTPSGLFYWGHVTAYDALGDTPRGSTSHEEIKLHYPYYELMWTVDPDATKKLIEALWCAHVMDWSNLDFNRIAPTTANLEEPWNQEYKGGPTFFNSKYGGRGFFVTGSSLIQAGTTLYRLSRQEQPLIWSKRLAKRFVDTRHPNTGIGTDLYNNPRSPLGEDLKEHFADPHTFIFPYFPFEETRYTYFPENVEAHARISLLLVGEMLGKKGRQFTQWALEELTAWGKASYRKRDNSFVPILTDGTRIEGYVSKKSNQYGPKGAVAKPLFADLSFFWGYAVAYRATSDEFMWEMARDISIGNSCGDIGRSPKDTPELKTDTTCSDVYGLLGFLELYENTKNPSFLQMSRRIGDNILLNQFHKGFFVPSKKHIYTRFDCFEPLTLLRLVAAIGSKSGSMPRVWPSCPLFTTPYRYKQRGVDRRVIYALTESPEPPLSLQEAAATGDIELVRSLLDKGVNVDSWDDPLKKTALQRAAMSGHKDVVELLLAKGARIEAQEDFPGGTALHYAAENGHREIAELLIAKGADINAKRRGSPVGDTPLHSAVRAGHKDIAELLLSKGAEVSSIHIAALLGDLARVKAFLERGTNVNAEDKSGFTPLHWAARTGSTDVAEYLIAHGANVNVGEDRWTPLQEAAYYSKEMVELLLAKGANINAGKWTALHSALDAKRFDIVELLLAKGADANIRDDKGRTPLHIAAWYAASRYPKIVELLLSKGADINAKDNNGKTALSYAIENGHKEIVELMRKHGAKE